MNRKNFLIVAVLIFFAGFIAVINMNSGEKLNNIAVSQEVFDVESLGSKVGVISFSSPNCSACLKQKEEFKKILPELSKDASFKSIDVTKDLQTANYYGVGIVPTILITYNGIEVERFTGVHKAGELDSEIRKQIEKHRYCEDGSIC